MAETEARMMVELNKHLGEFRVNLARRFEEQKLHSQYMENQMMEMKELLLNMAKGQQEEASAPRSPTSPLNEQSQSVDDYLGRFECAHHVLDKMSEPKESHNLELSDEEKLKCDELVHRDVEPSQILVEREPNLVKESSDSTAHQVLEEMPMGDGPLKLQEMDDFEPLKVISIPLLGVSDIEYENKNEWVADSVEPIGLSWGDVLITSTKALDIFSAHKLFDELPKRKTEANSMSLSSTVVYLEIKIMVDDSCLIVVDNMGLVFDPGGVVDHGRYRFDSSYAAGLVHIWSELVC